VSPLTRAWRVVQQVHWLVSGLLILDYMGSKCDKKEILPCPSLEKIKQAPQLQKKMPQRSTSGFRRHGELDPHDMPCRMTRALDVRSDGASDGKDGGSLR
jgi:hypothetical protein